MSSVDYTTIETVNGNPSLVSTLRPLYEFEITTSQVGAKILTQLITITMYNIELIVKRVC